MLWFIIILAISLLIFTLNRYARSLRVNSFDKKHVVVTGCDSGFGKLLAVKLDSMGFHVHAGCLTKPGQEALSQLASSRLKTFALDITDPESIRKAHDNIAQLLQAGLWALVNNAGISGVEAPVEMCTLEDFESAMKVNLFGHIAMTKAFLPSIRKAKGRVVNITSVAGRFAVITAPYCTSKFAFEGFSDCLRRELSPLGVKVSIVEPGLFKTEILNTQMAMSRAVSAYERSSEEVKKAYGENFLPKLNKQYTHLVKEASDARYLVVNAYVHAITAKFPRSRYVVGKDAQFVYIPATFLPDWLADPVIHFVKEIL